MPRERISLAGLRPNKLEILQVGVRPRHPLLHAYSFLRDLAW